MLIFLLLMFMLMVIDIEQKNQLITLLYLDGQHLRIMSLHQTIILQLVNN
jgi:hypothetical protein